MFPWHRSWPSVSSGPKRFSWQDMAEELPVDVLPCSNEEYFPPPPSVEQRAIMALADAETERWRTKLHMTRAQFVRTAAATAIGFWAIDAVRLGRFGNYGWAHNTATTDACDLEWDGHKGRETLRNLRGEFIFDVQSHHVDPDGIWRVNNPALAAFFAAVWPQARPVGGGGEDDPIENLSRHHYLKELFLDSATTMTVLSCVPTSPDAENPLPLAQAAKTVRTVNRLARSRRSVMHAFVMPNRGALTREEANTRPPFLERELYLMYKRAKKYRDVLRGWKTYPAWGSAPGASGWFLDSDTGMAFLEQVANVSRRVKQVPPVVATHKGFALPGFDQSAATPRDVGPAARQNRDVTIIVYHSGYDIGDVQRPYRGDRLARSDTNTVDGLIKSLRENRYDATRFVKKGREFGNVPNVYAELGSVWRNVMNDPDQAAHLLGKLIRFVGPKRIAWGTDSLWYGSPQAEIVAFRRFEFTEEGKELYGLPYGLRGDVKDPTRKAPTPERTIRNAILGRNAARAYRIDVDERRRRISCDAVNDLREGAYLTGRAGTESESAPLASNVAPGPRTRREVLRSLREGPWSP
jgi:hypothetical protein